MASVRIVTDSACDLPDDEARRLGIEIVPLSIRFGADEYTDRVELGVDEFYKRMATSAALPETAAPSPGAFQEAFRKAGAGGASVVCVNLSSGLSATMQAAQNAATAVAGEVDVRVVDSQSVTAGLGTQVLAAARAANDGATADQVVALVEDMRERTKVYGTLDTLENLKKGGRIGAAKALLGTMLSFKPLIEVKEGVVGEAGRARTRKKALGWVAEKLLEQPQVENLAVMHGQADDIGEFLALIEPRYSSDDMFVSTIGAVIGAHAGPGVVGVSFQVPRS
jgi:DegV family protein with EDD domain